MPDYISNNSIGSNDFPYAPLRDDYINEQSQALAHDAKSDIQNAKTPRELTVALHKAVDLRKALRQRGADEHGLSTVIRNGRERQVAERRLVSRQAGPQKNLTQKQLHQQNANELRQYSRAGKNAELQRCHMSQEEKREIFLDSPISPSSKLQDVQRKMDELGLSRAESYQKYNEAHLSISKRVETSAKAKTHRAAQKTIDGCDAVLDNAPLRKHVVAELLKKTPESKEFLRQLKGFGIDVERGGLQRAIDRGENHNVDRRLQKALKSVRGEMNTLIDDLPGMDHHLVERLGKFYQEAAAEVGVGKQRLQDLRDGHDLGATYAEHALYLATEKDRGSDLTERLIAGGVGLTGKTIVGVGLGVLLLQAEASYKNETERVGLAGGHDVKTVDRHDEKMKIQVKETVIAATPFAMGKVTGRAVSPAAGDVVNKLLDYASRLRESFNLGADLGTHLRERDDAQRRIRQERASK